MPGPLSAQVVLCSAFAARSPVCSGGQSAAAVDKAFDGLLSAGRSINPGEDTYRACQCTCQFADA